jgi:hypothetical protein
MLKVFGEKCLRWRECLCQINHIKLFVVAVAAIFWFAKLAVASVSQRAESTEILGKT